MGSLTPIGGREARPHEEFLVAMRAADPLRP